MRSPFGRFVGILLILLAVLMFIFWNMGTVSQPAPTVHSTLNDPTIPPPVK